ncbi:hypothetical protein [Rhizobium rhizoryzae]|uniref:hypothetical protein n=1 Tax=Rhizobium rhizoryzae TaxID=451876 RepID=UPI00289875E0|nr:hypothetical protein [Rhizobium rhizoryzae]
MTHRSVAVFLRPGILSVQVRTRWFMAGIELIDCNSVEDLLRIPVKNRLGALLDAQLDVDYLFDISEELERLGVPFLFLAPEDGPWTGYHLRSGRGHISRLVEALLLQGDDGQRH